VILTLFSFPIAGDLKTVKHLVEEEGALVNIIQLSTKNNIIQLGDSPLSVACRLGNVEIVQYLLEKNPNGIDMLHHPEKRSVLHLVMLCGSLLPFFLNVFNRNVLDTRWRRRLHSTFLSSSYS
jgi:hypothetical protein